MCEKVTVQIWAFNCIFKPLLFKKRMLEILHTPIIFLRDEQPQKKTTFGMQDIGSSDVFVGILVSAIKINYIVLFILLKSNPNGISTL